MKKTVATLMFSALIVSCDLDASADKLENKDTQLISIVEQSEKIEDSASPVGYWEVTKRFPKLSDSHNQSKTVNALISQLIEKYRCDSSGDETFTAEVTYASKNILSFRYEAMWLCPPMWSPDSDEGALTIDLVSGRVLDIHSEFASEEGRQTVLSEVRKALDKRIAAVEKANGISCNDGNSVDHFYVTSADIVFLHSADTHGESACRATFSMSKESLSNYLKKESRLLD